MNISGRNKKAGKGRGGLLSETGRGVVRDSLLKGTFAENEVKV